MTLKLMQSRSKKKKRLTVIYFEYTFGVCTHFIFLKSLVLTKAAFI